MKPSLVHLALGARSHDVVIGRGLLAAVDSWAGLPRAALAVVVTNSTVGPLYTATVCEALRGHYPTVSVIELPDGEQHKDWRSLDLIVDRLLAAHADRRTLLVALGGGVVGDLTGFAAASYMRGVPFVQVPTTLLAQVDSSVGGKTAINHARGKNMIGAFYQPQRVLCDLDTLDTLPERELSAGLAEVIKYGPIADAEFLDWIEANLDALLARDKPALMHAVRRSCEIKAQVVALDEREAGLREMLNFGHTFGHAIEAGLGYGVWLHGEAVACGMVLASELSVRLGMMPPSFAQRMRELVRRAGLPVAPPALGVERWLELMRVDKKADNGQIRYVLIEQVGKAVTRSVPESVVRDLLGAHGA